VVKNAMDWLGKAPARLYPDVPAFVFDYDRATSSPPAALREFLSLFKFANVSVRNQDMLPEIVDIHGGKDRGGGHISTKEVGIG